MNRRSLFWLALIVLSMLTTLMFAEFAGGSGTQTDPWLVETAEHLDNVRNYLGYEHDDKHYLQIADIDLGVPPWNQGEGWVPIGVTGGEAYFEGSYDGGGHIISGLYIFRPDNNYQGLFGIAKGKIQNLGLENCEVRGKNYVGGLGGSIRKDIDNCYCTGAVSADYDYVGGLVGLYYHHTISNSYFVGTVSGGTLYTGGLLGRNSNGYIKDCYTVANVVGQKYTGGMVGHADYNHYYRCCSSGTVIGTEFVGGFAGKNNDGQLYNSYSTANVSGGKRVGGLLGDNSGFIVENCYSIGAVSGNDMVGGLIGRNNVYTPATNSYWDIEKSGQSSSATGEGRLTSEMVFPHSDDTYMDWDWETWAPDTDHVINDGYPYLRTFHDDVGIDDPVPPIVGSSISAFPRPAFKAPRVSIKSEMAGKLSYTIYNVRGQKLYSAEIYSHDKEQSFELPFEAWKQLSNGVFLLTLEREKQRIASSRMVVVK